MASYIPKKILLPAGLDEIGLDRSLTRLPEESLIHFKRRLLLEHRDPVSNSFQTFKKSAGRQVGTPDIAIAKLTLTDDSLLRPRLQITSTKLYWWNDSAEEPTITLDLIKRDESYFLTDVIDALTSLGVLSIELLDTDYTYRYSRYLSITDTEVNTVSFLAENYVNNLNQGLVNTLRFTDSLVFLEEKDNSSELNVTGDYSVDYTNGVIFSNDLQRGYVSYNYANFPFILWWQPVRVFELNDQDVDSLIKEELNIDEGASPLSLNWKGTAYINELLRTYPLEWGE